MSTAPDLRRCRAPSCSATCRPDAAADSPRQFYCKAHWNHLRDHLLAVGDRLYPLARSLYVGRSNYPERRLIEHWHRSGREQLALLYWSGERAEIEFLESWLISHYGQRRKGVNLAHDSGGRWTGLWNCVYLSWTWKNGANPPPDLRGQPVRELDDGRRLVPARNPWPGPATYLAAAMAQEVAASELQRLKANRSARRAR